MAASSQRANRFINALTRNYIIEWSLVVTGAVVFIAGFIAGTVALRHSSITWAVFDFVLGIVGLIVFFMYALQLFFKITLPLMLCFQETLTHQMGKMRHQINAVDVGTMTDPEESQITNPDEDQMAVTEENQATNPKENRKTNLHPMTGTKESRKMLMSFPYVDRSKSLACDRHPRMRSQNVLDDEDRNRSQQKEAPHAAIVGPVPVHAVEGSSQEPLYYVLDDNSQLESPAEDHLADEMPEDVKPAKRKFEGNDSASYPDYQKFCHSVKALNLSPRKLLAQESKFHSLSSNFMQREMTPSKEYEMSLLHAWKKNSKSDLESSFLVSRKDVNPDPALLLLNSRENIKPCLPARTSSSTSRPSVKKCFSLSQQNPLPNDVNETPQVAEQQPLNVAQECVHPDLLKPYAPLAEETFNLSHTKNEDIFPNDTVSSRIPRTQSCDRNQAFDNKLKQLPPLPPKDSSSDANSEKLYIRPKRKSLTPPTPEQDALEDQYSGLVQRFY